ncbi:MAG TPA: hypothetical protein VGD56_00645 [Gemmatirosa sp.]
MPRECMLQDDGAAVCVPRLPDAATDRVHVARGRRGVLETSAVVAHGNLLLKKQVAEA